MNAPRLGLARRFSPIVKGDTPFCESLFRGGQSSHGRSGPERVRIGFTLIELLVVIAVIGVLTGLLLPALNFAHESSRSTNCLSNLRQFGVGLAIHAEQRKGYFCTGAFDWQRDGAVTEIGWVADLNSLSIPTGKMLCPSNPARVSETFNDLLALDASHLDSCVDRLGQPPQALPDGTKTVNPCYRIVKSQLEAASEERRVLVQEEIIKPHFNTNYTASWILVRSRPRLDRGGNVASHRKGCPNSLLSRTATGGPLHQSFLDSSRVPSSTVPFLGCGATTGTLQQTLGDFPEGTFVSQTFTPGPLRKGHGREPLVRRWDVTRGPRRLVGCVEKTNAAKLPRLCAGASRAQQHSDGGRKCAVIRRSRWRWATQQWVSERCRWVSIGNGGSVTRGDLQRSDAGLAVAMVNWNPCNVVALFLI